MLKEDIRFSESTILEGMPSISALIRAMELSLHDRRIIKILFDRAKQKKKIPEFNFLQANSVKHGFELCLVDAAEIDAQTIGSTHGGIIAICTDRTLISLNKAVLNSQGIYYMLDGVEDPYNFGNSLRALYAFGADGIILTARNWMSAAGVVARSSAGTSELFPMFVADSAVEAANYFHRNGFSVICAGIRDSVSIHDASLRAPLLVIIGGERRGISSQTLQCADQIVRIDYQSDFHGSLSTSASAAFSVPSL